MFAELSSAGAGAGTGTRTLEIIFERHVESLSNTAPKISQKTSKRKAVPDSPPSIPAPGTLKKIAGNGLMQLQNIEKEYFNMLQPEWKKWEDIADSISFRFETSTLRRAQLTAIYARNSLIENAYSPGTGLAPTVVAEKLAIKLRDAPFSINGALREDSKSGSSTSILGEEDLKDFKGAYLKTYLRGEDVGPALGDLAKKFFPENQRQLLMPDLMMEILARPALKLGDEFASGLEQAIDAARPGDNRILNINSNPKKHDDLNAHLSKLAFSDENKGDKKLVVIMTGHGTKYKKWLESINKHKVVKKIPKLFNGKVVKIKLEANSDGTLALSELKPLWDGPLPQTGP